MDCHMAHCLAGIRESYLDATHILSQQIDVPLLRYHGIFEFAEEQRASFSAEQLFRGEYTKNLENLDSRIDLTIRVSNCGDVLIL